MAASLFNFARNAAKTAFCANMKAYKHAINTQSRNITNVSTRIPGTIPDKPLKNKASVPKVAACFFVGIYTGQYVAKSFAAFMEETELFVPEDDDD